VPFGPIVLLENPAATFASGDDFIDVHGVEKSLPVLVSARARQFSFGKMFYHFHVRHVILPG
jgi:hypothetical protein